MTLSIAQNRQTNHSARKMASKLINSNAKIAADLLNEFGVIFLNANNSPRAIQIAEHALVSALTSLDADIRHIAYCQLKRANGTTSNKVHTALSIFQFNVANKHIIENAATQYWLS